MQHALTVMNIMILVAMAASLMPVEQVCNPGKSSVHTSSFLFAPFPMTFLY